MSACEHCRPGWPTPRRPGPDGFIVVSSALCVSLENFKFPELSGTELAVPVLLPLCPPGLSAWAAAALYPTKPRRGAGKMQLVHTAVQGLEAEPLTRSHAFYWPVAFLVH